MTIKKKIYFLGLLIFVVLIAVTALNVRMHLHIVSIIRERDEINKKLAAVEDFLEWKNELIQVVSAMMISGKAPTTADLTLEPPFGIFPENRSALSESTEVLIDTIRKNDTAELSIENQINFFHTEVNDLYSSLEQAISTELARSQMNQVLGIDSREENFLAPYILKSLNQLTLVALNSLFLMDIGDETESTVEKNRNFIKNQLQIIDSRGDIRTLFDKLFQTIANIQSFIRDSSEIRASFDTRIDSAVASFNAAVDSTNIDTVAEETRNAQVKANQTLQSTSRLTLLLGILFMLVIPVFIVTLGVLSLNKLVIKRLIYLETAMKKFQSGDIDISTEISGDDEIGHLAQAFTMMTEEIKNKMDELSYLNRELTESGKEIRRANTYISNIINSMPSVLIGVDQDLVITQWNSEAERLSEIPYKQAVGQPLKEIVPSLARYFPHIRAAMKTREIRTLNHEMRHTGEMITYEDMTFYPLVSNGIEGAVIRIDDVTEKVQLEEMMIQNEKMLSVGGLAAGMAHEINNPLAGIVQTIHVLEERLDDDAHLSGNTRAAESVGTTMATITDYMKERDIFRMIDTIKESASRVADIVLNMLSFSRKADSSVSSHYLEDLFEKTLELAATDYDLKKKYDFKNIMIKKEYSPDKYLVPCEATKIQQVFLNILRNGAQAMESADTPEPCFTIQTGYDEFRRMAFLSIRDNGPGMEEDVRKRVFEPFYTTKPVGRGTGLGLSVSYFIITENHSGDMTVETTSGNGSQFTVYLPADNNGDGEKK